MDATVARHNKTAGILQEMMTLGRLWWLIKRDCKRGWSASWHAHFTAGQILQKKRRTYRPGAGEIPVHVLTGKDTWLLTAWMLASWEYFTERGWNIVLHDDGTLTGEIYEQLSGLFPGMVIIWRHESNQEMSGVLEQMPLCAEYRKRHPLALKIFDVPHFCRTTRFILLDSDVLFFKRPDRVLEWIQSGIEECLFNADVEEATLVPAGQALEYFNIHLQPRVNSGLCLLVREAFEPAQCEQFLARTKMLEGNLWRVEQTLFALCASRYGRCGLLPEDYEVSLKRDARRDSIARHYVGAVRNRFYGEGIAQLRRTLLQET